MARRRLLVLAAALLLLVPAAVAAQPFVANFTFHGSKGFVQYRLWVRGDLVDEGRRGGDGMRVTPAVGTVENVRLAWWDEVKVELKGHEGRWRFLDPSKPYVAVSVAEDGLRLVQRTERTHYL